MSIVPLITQQAYACMKLPCWFAHPHGSQHQKVLWEYSSFTETIISRKQRAVSTFARTSPPPNGDYSAPQNIKVRSAPAAWAPGPPVLACRSAACTVAAWAVVRQAASIWKDTGGEVTIHVRVLYCVVRPKGSTIWGLHGVYFSPATTYLGTWHDWPAVCCPQVSYIAYALHYRRRRQKTYARDRH